MKRWSVLLYADLISSCYANNIIMLNHRLRKRKGLETMGVVELKVFADSDADIFFCVAFLVYYTLRYSKDCITLHCYMHARSANNVSVRIEGLK